jgi:hypothetical protein
MLSGKMVVLLVLVFGGKEGFKTKSCLSIACRIIIAETRIKTVLYNNTYCYSPNSVNKHRWERERYDRQWLLHYKKKIELIKRTGESRNAKVIGGYFKLLMPIKLVPLKSSALASLQK